MSPGKPRTSAMDDEMHQHLMRPRIWGLTRSMRRETIDRVSHPVESATAFVILYALLNITQRRP